jgi:hypothetical protein
VSDEGDWVSGTSISEAGLFVPPRPPPEVAVLEEEPLDEAFAECILAVRLTLMGQVDKWVDGQFDGQKCVGWLRSKVSEVGQATSPVEMAC